jgi:hypothetical protein
MARERGKVELSLFPFLNILFSLIGVLILYIFVVLVLGRAGGRASIQAGLVRGRAAARDETRELDAVSKKRMELAAAHERKTRELERLESEKEQLTQLLELRTRQELMPAAGTSTVGVPIGAPVPKEWRMIPADKGSGDNRKTPILVRISAERFTVYDFDAKGALSRTREFPAIGSPQTARPSTPKTRGPKRGGQAAGTGPLPEPDPRFVAFLDGLNRPPRDRYALFLIGPDGIEQFGRIKDFCDQNYPTLASKSLPKNPRPADIFDLGFEPFSNDWLLVRKARN